MPREPRQLEPNVVYHLISRYIGREYLVTNQLQRNSYLQLQGRSLRENDWRLLGFALMSNHIHLVALAGRRALDSWLRRVHSPFADMINVAHERIGPVFVRGPKAFPVANRDVGRVLAYVHNNPVRAGVVPTAAQSSWTSHRAYVGKTDAQEWLHVGLGLEIARVRREEFDSLVNDPAQLADRSFSEAAHELALQREQEQEVLPKRAYPEVAHAIVEATARALDVPATQIRSTSRHAPEVLARAVAVSCSAMLGVHEVDIARALNLSQQRVSVLRRQRASNDVLGLAALVHERVRAFVTRTPTHNAPDRLDDDASAGLARLSSK